MDKKRILAVEDNTVNLATLEQELSKHYEVIPMSAGPRAIKYLERCRVDLILLDVQMPGMSGIEVLQTVRTMEHGVNVPVIFLTASKEKSTVIEGSRLGICDYIVKPFDPEKLHGRIEAALANIKPRPIDNQQLIVKINEILTLMGSGSLKEAVTKAEETLGYAIEQEVAIRVESAKQKIKSADLPGAERILLRTIQFVNHLEQERLQANNTALNQIGIKNRLQLILNDLRNFKTEEAKEQLGNLMAFRIPEAVFERCQQIMNLLNEFDESGAEMIIMQTIQML